jgi:hypothetical protein
MVQIYLIKHSLPERAPGKATNAAVWPMSRLGHKAKSSTRANVFRFTPISDRTADNVLFPVRAKRVILRCRKTAPLFDHLVGE